MVRFRILALVMAAALLVGGLVGCACAEAVDTAAGAPQAETSDAAPAADDAGNPEEAQAAEGDPADIPAVVEEQAVAQAAEDEGVDAVEGAGKPVLYIVLADCGTTLYGGQVFNGSVVTEIGDPDGSILSLIAAAPPLLCPEASIALMGYHSELVNQKEAHIARMTDADAVDAQVRFLLDTDGTQRLSSDLISALRTIEIGINNDWAEQYDCRLVLLTGGALNYANADGKPTVSDLKETVDALRDKGVGIRAFGFDLSGSGILAPNANADGLLLSAAQFSEAEYTSIPVADAGELPSARLKYAAAVLDYFAEQGGYQPGEVCAPDQVTPDADEVYALWSEEAHRYQACSGLLSRGLSPETTAENATAIRRCQRVEEPVPAPDIHAVVAVLDADGNGVLDASPLVAGFETAIPCAPLNAEQFTVTSGDPGVLDAQITDANALRLIPHAAGSVALTFASVENPEDFSAFSVQVKAYTLKWSFEADAEFELFGADAPQVSTDEGELGWLLERQGAEEHWEAVDSEIAETTLNEGTLIAKPLKPGSYRLTAWITADGQEYARETRAFSARMVFDPVVESVTYKIPYFAEQKDQRIPLIVGGYKALVEGFSAAVDPAELADVYLDAGTSCLYLVPKAPGTGAVTLSDEMGNELLTIQVQVNRLTGQPLFWVLVAAVPLCLIGLTAMIVIMIAKNKRK